MILLGSLLFLAASILALGIATWWGPAPCPVDVRPETCDALDVGMSERDIEAILGGPAGDYRTRKDVGYLFVTVGWPAQPHEITRKWDTDAYAIRVRFSRNGKAVSIMGARGIDTSPTLGERYPVLRNLEPLISFLEGFWHKRFVMRHGPSFLGPLVVVVVSLVLALWVLRKQGRRQADGEAKRTRTVSGSS